MMFTPLLPRTVLRRVVLVALFALLVVRGIIPAFSGMDTDFPNYYTAGSIAREGQNVERLYDDAWFQEQIHARGMEQQGKFSPFPPVTAVVFIPFSLLSPDDAFRAMTILNLILLAAVVPVLTRAIPSTAEDALLLVLFAGVGLANTFRFGQMYIAVSLSIIGAFALVRAGRQYAGGLCLGLFVPLKYYPAIFLALHAVRGEWRVLAGAAVSATLVALAGIMVLGMPVHSEFFNRVIGGHFSGNLSLQNPYSATFQSLDVLLRRLFSPDPVLNPDPFLSTPFLVPLIKTIVFVTVLTILLLLLLRIRRSESEHAPGLGYALLGITGLLLAPATATYHWLLLWLPAGALLQATVKEPLQSHIFWGALVSYTVVGFIPYRLTSAFEGAGLGTVLAFPRLFFTLILFITAVSAVRRLPSGISAQPGTPT